MATDGQMVGGGLGLVIGGIIGGPYGAFVGFSIGYGIGSYIDPPVIEEETDPVGRPDISDLTLAPADETIPIPDAVGMVKITGNIIHHAGAFPIWDWDIDGFVYYHSWAVGICQGPIDQVVGVYKDEDLFWYGNESAPSGGMVNLPLPGGEEEAVSADEELEQVLFAPHSSTISIDDRDTAWGTWGTPTENYSEIWIGYLLLSQFDIDFVNGETGDPTGNTLDSVTVQGGVPGNIIGPLRTVDIDNLVVGATRSLSGGFTYVTCPLDGAIGVPAGTPLIITMNYTSELTEEEEILYEMGDVDFYFGTTDQESNASLAARLSINSDYNPPLRNICWAYFDNCQVGTSGNRCPTMRFVIRKYPSIGFDDEYRVVNGSNYNGAHALWYTLVTLAHLPSDYVDQDSFSSAARRLYAEGLGVNILFRNGSVGDYVDKILAHIDGVLTYKIADDGNPKFHLQLLRDDTDTDTLPIITESVLLEPPSLKRRSWSEISNEVRVNYTSLIGTEPTVANQMGSITTEAVSSIDTTTATGNGTVVNVGIPTATQHGVCWNLTGSPTVEEGTITNMITEEGVPSLGVFTSSMSWGLVAGTRYYVRAYITNSVGTFYGNEVRFTTEESTMPSGQQYYYPGGTFNGSSDFENTGEHFLTTFRSSWTLAFKASPDDGQPVYPNELGIFGNMGTTDYFHVTHDYNGDLKFTFKANGVDIVVVAGGVFANGPSSAHVMIIFNYATMKQNCYVDNVEKTDQNITGFGPYWSVYNPSYVNFVGRINNLSNSYFDGGITTVRLYNKALSSAERAIVYANDG